MPDHPAGARRVFLRVAGEVGVAVHEHTGVQKVRGTAKGICSSRNRMHPYSLLAGVSGHICAAVPCRAPQEL